MCVTVTGRARASLFSPSYLLHLSYDFHLELNKLQSKLFQVDLGRVLASGEVDGVEGERWEIGLRRFPVKEPEKTLWLLPSLQEGQAQDPPLLENPQELSVSQAFGKQPPVDTP